MTSKTRMSHEKAADRETARVPEPPEATGDLRHQAFIGTSGWSYSSWKPGFYPQTVPQKKFLEYYAAQLNSVEVNYTFNHLPTQSMLTGRLAASDASFRFSFKAPQRITHFLGIKDCSDAVAVLSRALAPVVAAGRMGVVLFSASAQFQSRRASPQLLPCGCEYILAEDGF